MEDRAIPFRETRKVHKSYESAEDYTELIAELIKEQGIARVCDLSKRMGVSHVTILKTVKRLIRDGYVSKDGHFILLTEKGQETASFSEKKHKILSDFLLKLGVPKAVVDTDVEGIEHHVSLCTLKALEKHLKKM